MKDKWMVKRGGEDWQFQLELVLPHLNFEALLIFFTHTHIIFIIITITHTTHTHTSPLSCLLENWIKIEDVILVWFNPNDHAGCINDPTARMDELRHVHGALRYLVKWGKKKKQGDYVCKSLQRNRFVFRNIKFFNVLVRHWWMKRMLWERWI